MSLNRQSFDLDTPNGRKHFQRLLDTLIDYNQDKEESHYNDIHISQEESFIIIEWDSVPYSHEWGGQWKYLEDDDVLMKEVVFPDNHYEYVFPDEVEETLEEWHKNNPDWVKTSYGTWTNTEENRRSNILWNIDNWSEKCESEKDSTFKLITTSKLNFEDTKLSALLSLASEDVLHETDYVVIHPKLIDAYYADKDNPELADNCYVTKLGTTTVELLYNDLTVLKDIKVYTVQEWTGDNMIIFVADTCCPICAIRGQ